MRSSPAQHRQLELTKMIERWGSVRAAEAAVRLGVALRTVQRDLDDLAAQGAVTRVHGGAVVAADPSAGATASPLRLGLLVPSRGHHFAAIRDGVTSAAQELGCTIIEGDYGYRKTSESTMLTRILELGLDGLLITPSAAEPGWHRLETPPVPTVIIERARRPHWLQDLPANRALAATPTVDHIHTDHGHGVALALDHLYGLGHRHVLALVRHTSTAEALLEALELHHRVLGGSRWGSLEVVELSDDDRSWAEIEQILFVAGGLDRASALLVHSDSVALHVWHAIRARGLDIPTDVSLVSYDDAIESRVVALTAVAQRRRFLGRRAVEMIVERLRSRGRRSYEAQPPVQVAVPPDLNLRGTTGPPRS